MEKLAYKLKHKPTGLFYQPVKGRWADDKSNLSIRGKVYLTKTYPKPYDMRGVNISKSLAEKFNIGFRQYSFSKERMVDTKPEDWEVITYKLVEINK